MNANSRGTLIGIDAGTTSVKAVLFALDGSVLASAHRDTTVARVEPGASEADMDAIFALTLEVLHEVLRAEPEREILAIGVTGQGDGAWLSDADGHPLGPAILWNDGRSGPVVDRWASDGRAAAVAEVTGSPLFPGALPAIWARVGDEVATRGAAHHLNCKDWIRFRLTGERATDPTEASRGYLDVRSGDYSSELAARLGQAEVLPLLPPVRASDALGGTLLPELQQRLGLPPTPVAIGAVDVAAAGVGLGALDDGDSFVVLGTTAVVGMNHPTAGARRHPASILLRTGRRDQVVECLAQMSGMPNLDWARRTLKLQDSSWPEIEAGIAACTSEDRPLFLPYTSSSGERAPFVDLHASAAWIGVRVTTDAWALMRSAYEGLSHSVYESLLGLGIGDADEESPIVVSGGGAQSELLCRLLADLSGREVIRQVDGEVGARGAAALALAAISPGMTLESAIASLRTGEQRIRPDGNRRGAALAGFETFRRVRDALRPHWPDIRPSDH